MDPLAPLTPWGQVFADHRYSKLCFFICVLSWGQWESLNSCWRGAYFSHSLSLSPATPLSARRRHKLKSFAVEGKRIDRRIHNIKDWRLHGLFKLPCWPGWGTQAEVTLQVEAEWIVTGA